MQFQNPYASYTANAAAFAEESERAGFIQRTYLHLGGAVAAFILLEGLLLTLIPAQTVQGLLRVAGGWAPLVILVAYMAVSWVARSWAESAVSPKVQYLGLSLYVVAEALIFVPLLHIAMRHGPSIPLQAALITALLFGGLTAFVFLTKSDFSSWGKYLWLAGLAAFGAAVAGACFGFSLGLFFSAAMVVLLCAYILYDTSNVMHHYGVQQHVAASLALFASVSTLMWYVTRILISMNDD